MCELDSKHKLGGRVTGPGSEGQTQTGDHGTVSRVSLPREAKAKRNQGHRQGPYHCGECPISRVPNH